MEGTKFREFFVWLSDSLSAVTEADPEKLRNYLTLIHGVM